MAKYTSEYLNAFRFIDECAKQDKVYHYNGGQAYIRLHDNWLMVIDHTTIDDAKVSIHEGTAYFETYEGNQFEYSKLIRENTLTEYFTKVGV